MSIYTEEIQFCPREGVPHERHCVHDQGHWMCEGESARGAAADPIETVALLRQYSADASKTAAYRLFYGDTDGQQESQRWANAMMIAAQLIEGAAEEVERAAMRLADAKIERDTYGWAIRRAPHDDDKCCGGAEPTDMSSCECWKSKALE
jgi:hypothetical protein